MGFPIRPRSSSSTWREGRGPRRAGRRFYVDDHTRPVLEEVFALLKDLIPRCPQLRAVTFEADGHSDATSDRHPAAHPEPGFRCPHEERRGPERVPWSAPHSRKREHVPRVDASSALDVRRFDGSFEAARLAGNAGHHQPSGQRDTHERSPARVPTSGVADVSLTEWFNCLVDL